MTAIEIAEAVTHFRPHIRDAVLLCASRGLISSIADVDWVQIPDLSLHSTVVEIRRRSTGRPLFRTVAGTTEVEWLVDPRAPHRPQSRLAAHEARWSSSP